MNETVIFISKKIFELSADSMQQKIKEAMENATSVGAEILTDCQSLSQNSSFVSKGNPTVDCTLLTYNSAALDDFIFKYAGPFANKTFDVAVSFYNESENITQAFIYLEKLERLFNIRKYLFVQNGSSDDTGDRLRALKKINSKVEVLENKTSPGYGFGFQTAFQAAKADYVITSHADCQFEPYSFFVTHFDTLMDAKDIDAIFPERLNRPTLAEYRTSLLQRMVGLLSRYPDIQDFNGHPKVLKNDILPKENLPVDFRLDLAVYLSFYKKDNIVLPVIEKPRFAGVSSWANTSGAVKLQVKNFLKFLKFALLYKKGK